MDATITIAGDRDVGIFDQVYTLSDLPEFDGAEHREEFRKALAEAFVVLTGWQTRVVFSDEYPRGD